MFCAHWANLRCTGKPVAVLAAHHFLWESEKQAQPFISLTKMLPSLRKNLTPHPAVWWKESTVNSWPSSGKCCPFLRCLCPVCVCVCVRKLNLLLAHCTPVTHSSCKLILYSCKFHFSVTMQAIWATGKGLLTTWSWPPPHLSVTTAPPQGAPEPCIQGAERGKVHWRLPAEIHSWIFIFRSTSHEAECQIQINGMCLFNLF